MALKTKELFLEVFGSLVAGGASITSDGAVITYSPRAGDIVYANVTMFAGGSGTTLTNTTWSGGTITFTAGENGVSHSAGDQLSVFWLGTA